MFSNPRARQKHRITQQIAATAALVRAAGGKARSSSTGCTDAARCPRDPFLGTDRIGHAQSSRPYRS
jgi:hypothetical protein